MAKMATRATKYIVIGRYDCERNSCIPDGDIRHVRSGHNTQPTAWLAAHRIHTSLGGCDGSDMLTKVMERYARFDSRKSRDFRTEADDGENPSHADWYEHAGWLYIECDFWAAHQIVPALGGLGLAVRE